MSDGFVKLDCGFVDSTTWAKRDVRDCFLAVLLKARPVTLTKPEKCLKIRELAPLGWEVPPGKYGLARIASPGVSRVALVALEPTLDALEELCAPDPGSRSQEFEGRRIVRVNGGFIVLNFQRYRDRDYTAAARAKRYRERKASRRDVTVNHGNVTEGEAKAKEGDGESTPPPPPDDREMPCPMTLSLPDDVAAELAKRSGYDLAVVRAAEQEFVAYWTIGGGMGKRRRHWMAKLRQDVLHKADSGKLDEIAARHGKARASTTPDGDGWKRL